MKRFFVILVFFLSFVPSGSFSQIGPSALPPIPSIFRSPLTETGRPFMTAYDMKTTGGQFQSWAFMQDHRGVMYVGNNAGVLEFDGATWRVIETANNSLVRSLTMDTNGRIYVGGATELGYLAPDDHGQLQYVSLLDQIKTEDRGFSYVWTTHVTPAGICFQTSERLFRFTPIGDEWQVKVWQPQGRFGFAFWCNGTYYVQQGGVGLMQMQGDSLRLLPGGDQFANDRLQVMLPFGSTAMNSAPQGGGATRDEKILVGTFTRGLFLFDGHSFQPFKTDADGFLRNNVLYSGAILADSTLGLTTINGGVVFLDQQGRALQYLNQTTGLISNQVASIFVDRQGAVWLAPVNGVYHVEIPSPLSRYDAASGLTEAAADISRHAGILYAAANNGLFYLDARTSTFKPVHGLAVGSPQCFDLLAVGKTLLVAVGTGVYQIKGTTTTIIKSDTDGSFLPICLHRSRQDSSRVFVGLYNGLASLRMTPDGSGWIDEGRIVGVHEYVTKIVEPQPGVLWLGTLAQGTLRVTISETGGSHLPQNSKVERFDHQHGLPSEGGVAVFSAAGRAFFVMREGVCRFDEARQKFFPDTLLPVVGFGGSPADYAVSEDRRGNIWLNFGRESAVLRRQRDGTYRPEKMALQRFADVGGVNVIYPENDPTYAGIVWFGSPEGLIRYDSRIQKNYTADFAALIRRVTVKADSVIFGGAVVSTGPVVPTLPYTLNALRFEFAAPSYDNSPENQFQSRLEGFDTQWSAWSRENKRDYTNLPEGNYRFLVRAKNIYQRESSEAVYAFRILPPWYRTWWAYGGYMMILGLLVFAAASRQHRRVIKRERRRAELREAQLRAEAENERRKNVELLSEIGKQITASLDMDTIFFKLYEHVNQLADATIFGVGIYHSQKEQIEYRLAIEKGKRYTPYSRDTRDKNQFPVWCIENRRPVFINDVSREYRRYISQYQEAPITLEDGSLPEEPQSLIYLPLISQDRVLGVITIQSFQKNAYTEYHLNLLQNLAAYTSIALDNADAYRRLDAMLQDLKATQQQLVVQQKLASLGQLTAGIAHEIKNPLNFVNNFATLSVDLANELRGELFENGAQLDAQKRTAIETLLADIQMNAEKINHHGKRADAIVRSMLQLSRGKSSEREMTDVNTLLNEALSLTYHGMRAQDASFNITIEKDYDESIGKLEVVPQDLQRVFLNILNNACYAAHMKTREGETVSGRAGEGERGREGERESGREGASVSLPFKPHLSVSTKNLDDRIEIRIRDNGNGIPQNIRDKIFNPFFTTKPAGQGTGLGLSISYDIIVQAHRGEIKVDTVEGEYTEIIISLPKK